MARLFSWKKTSQVKTPKIADKITVLHMGGRVRIKAVVVNEWDMDKWGKQFRWEGTGGGGYSHIEDEGITWIHGHDEAKP